MSVIRFLAGIVIVVFVTGILGITFNWDFDLGEWKWTIILAILLTLFGIRVAIWLKYGI